MPNDIQRSGVLDERFVSPDMGEVEDLLRSNYADVALRRLSDAEKFLCRHDAVGAEGYMVSRMRTSLAYSAQLDGTDGQFVIATVRAGGFNSTSDRHGELGGWSPAIPPSLAGGARRMGQRSHRCRPGRAQRTHGRRARGGGIRCGGERRRMTGLSPGSEALCTGRPP